MARNRVEYVARVQGGVVENVTLFQRGGCAALKRFGRTVTVFVPSAIQRRRIRSGRGGKGTVRITTKQIAAGQRRCGTGLAGLRKRRGGRKAHCC